eukprot:TRINITY_DN1472_c0_g1_i1.p1 TRINITY_DN1472_c0_g1~~TRINITY_DN1472_c0_g1_i1.p1  ORF type:complete len:728 (+),score=167.18 TRINITY_DN1472_c0_g1_i1:110-2293(+)
MEESPLKRLRIAVEPFVDKHKIHHTDAEGVEHPDPDPSPAEKLATLRRQLERQPGDGSRETEPARPAVQRERDWPWRNVHNQLLHARVEIEHIIGFVDLLQHQQLGITTVAQPPPGSAAVQRDSLIRELSKKQELQAASEKLAKSAASLRQTVQREQSYFDELMNLRSRWLLTSKTTGRKPTAAGGARPVDKLFVDYGYRSLGSKTKAEAELVQTPAGKLELVMPSGHVRKRLVITYVGGPFAVFGTSAPPSAQHQAIGIEDVGSMLAPVSSPSVQELPTVKLDDESGRMDVDPVASLKMEDIAPLPLTLPAPLDVSATLEAAQQSQFAAELFQMLQADAQQLSWCRSFVEVKEDTVKIAVDTDHALLIQLKVDDDRQPLPERDPDSLIMEAVLQRLMIERLLEVRRTPASGNNVPMADREKRREALTGPRVLETVTSLFRHQCLRARMRASLERMALCVPGLQARWRPQSTPLISSVVVHYGSEFNVEIVIEDDRYRLADASRLTPPAPWSHTTASRLASMDSLATADNVAKFVLYRVCVQILQQLIDEALEQGVQARRQDLTVTITLAQPEKKLLSLQFVPVAGLQVQYLLSELQPPPGFLDGAPVVISEFRGALESLPVAPQSGLASELLKLMLRSAASFPGAVSSPAGQADTLLSPSGAATDSATLPGQSTSLTNSTPNGTAAPGGTPLQTTPQTMSIPTPTQQPTPTEQDVNSPLPKLEEQP